MKEFDLEELERKNIYKIPENMFENVQENVMIEVKIGKRAPVFKLIWTYAVAASLALIFGVIFAYNSHDSLKKSGNAQKTTYALSNQEPKTESEIAYETLKSDLMSIENENNNQIVDNQKNNKVPYVIGNNLNLEEKTTNDQTVNTVSKQIEAQISEYLDSFSNSEIAQLASYSTQDVYLDLYN